jgi:hypothetical protein
LFRIGRDNDGFEQLDAVGFEHLFQVVEHGLVGVGTDDDPARAGELGRSPHRTGQLHHLDVARGDIDQAAAQVEIPVNQGSHPDIVTGTQVV